ncbi:MAG: 2-oxoglutarate translocator [Alphaproteobacteria bacterium]|nr:2-oxoglutarate translocator [Alphaproteobacteria bacterium]
MTQLWRFFVPLLVGICIWLMPLPPGMDSKAWSLFAIFTATILALICRPLPLGAVCLMSMVIAVMAQDLTLSQALSGFGNPVIWLILLVFFIARAFIKTHLGMRIAYFFVSLIGKHTLGLAYGIVGTELLIAPVIPSNGARAGGIMYPILKSIAESLDSRVGDGTERRVGAYLTQVCFQGNLITSAMFLTAMAANPMAQSMAKAAGVDITWTNWFTAAIVPGLLSIILIPLLLYFVYPPEIKHHPHAMQLAKDKLKEMGPMSRDEWTMVGVFIFMLFFWIFGIYWHIEATTTALIGVSLLLLTNVLSWEDVLNEKEAWHIFIWFGVLVTMANYLQILGFVDWFSLNVGGLIKGYDWEMVFLAIVLVYFYSHYLFASNTAHVGAMYAAFLAVAIASGTPPLLAALVLGFCSNLFSSMTHYGSTASVVLYGAGYVPLGTWWSLGLLVSIANLVIWLGAGGVWWKVLGLW